MTKFTVALAVLLTLGACSGDGTNPFDDDEPTDSDNTPGPEDPITATEPTEEGGGETGDGFATGFSYDSNSDTFRVDNLAFDGDNTYERSTVLPSIGPFNVYEASAQYPDDLTGSPINQLTHRAIYGISDSGSTEFAIVRTGAYVNYGFGGFVYKRNGGVELPRSGQAGYTGQLAGIRDFDGQGGIQYTAADIDIAIDFDDFNDATGVRGDGVQGQIYNRQVFDEAGNDITAAVITSINVDESANLTAIPEATFTIGPSVLDANGQLTGELTSFFVNNAGQTVQFESGNYYAIVSGSNAQEIVGVVVTTSTAGQPTGVTARETGGFVVYR